MTNHWKKLEPITESSYLLEKIVEDEAGLHLIFINELNTREKKYVDFVTRIFSYKVTNLHYQKKIQLSNLPQNGLFFVVHNSTYKQYFIDKKIFSANDFIQISCITKEVLIDILTSSLPAIILK